MIRLLAINLLLILSVGLSAQPSSEEANGELANIIKEYQLSEAQKIQASKLIQKRNQDLLSIAANTILDEPHRSLKRSSIIKGFEGSFNLILNDHQRSTVKQKTIKERKERVTAIEELKKKGYSQAEILKQLDNKVKSH